MKRSEAAAIVKKAVDMRDVAGMYGLKVERGMALCPFHSDKKSPSLKLYRDGWKCFGCNLYGDAIDFVQRMTGGEYWDAVSVLNDAFKLGIALYGKASPPEQKKQAEHAAKLIAQREEEQKQRELAQTLYWHTFDRYMFVERCIDDREPFSPLWCWAIKRKDELKDDMDRAEIRLNEANKHG